MGVDMYQLEVKRYLAEYQFPPTDGWTITVDVDSMERAEGGQHRDDKRERAWCAEKRLKEIGATIGPHPDFGRADLVAMRDAETFVVEAEGESSKQKSTALYSALGQVILLMRENACIRYGIAFPDTRDWERQLEKIPRFIRDRLSLTCWLVSKTGVRQL